MVRFIFVCMGVVALSLLSLAGQFMLDGIEEARDQVAARNDAPVEADVVAVETTVNPEDLNNIEAAAGDALNDAQGNQTFGDAFSSDVPAGLQDTETQPSAIGTTPVEDAGH